MVSKPDPRLRLIEQIGEWKVYLVNGRLARQWYKDFTQGANFMAYAKGSRFAERGTAKFPDKEIWVEEMLDHEEEGFNEYHELGETCDMIEFHFVYEHAHEIANSNEFGKARAHPERLPELMDKLRKRCLKLQAEQLGQDEDDGEYDDRIDPDREDRFTADLGTMEIITPGKGVPEKDVAPQGISRVVNVYPGEE